jgi:hypothetical protein
MTRSIAALFGALCLVGTAGANGGGFRYGVEFTGGVAPFEPSGTERVQIIDEKLDITLYEGDAEVHVRYVMKNITGRKAKVTFGFPLEATEPVIYAKDQKVTTKIMAERSAKYCRDYQVTADGKAVAHKQKMEPFAFGKLRRFKGSDQIEGIAAWQVSSLDFASGQERVIEIRYGVDHDKKGSTTSNDSTSLPPVFRYRLSTGGVWAGPIQKGRVRVMLGDADPKWVEIKKPAGRFQRDGDAWVWNFKDLEPTLADDIEITAGPLVNHFCAVGNGEAFYLQTGLNFWKKKRGEKHHEGWQYLSKTYAVEASSTLPDAKPHSYGVENLKNWDWVTDRDDSYLVWSEGAEGHGIGEFLTLTASKPLPLDAIRVHPGYGRSEVLFKANSRPSKLKVTLNGEHSFEATLRDVNLDQTVKVSGYSKPVKTVRLEIADVYPGWEFEDTCISDIALISPLNEEPLRYGAR